MNFSDLFKKDFFNTAVQDLTIGRILLALGTAFAIGLFIHVVYKKTFRGVLYSRSFNTSLISITMITSFVIVAVTSNVVLSLGMVGALSIVRFRTAVKDPMDLVYLFWAIATGIVTGAGLYALSIIGAVIIGLALFLLSRSPSGDMPYLLVIQATGDEADANARKALTGAKQAYSVKSRTVSRGAIETTYEIRLKDSGADLVNEIAAVSGVDNAVLIAYNGDYVS